jgi:hypothetical protein
VRINFPGALYEMRLHADSAGPVREVEGVDWDAVAAPARSRVETVEAEGFGGGGVEHLERTCSIHKYGYGVGGRGDEHLPNVDVHLVEDHF